MSQSRLLRDESAQVIAKIEELTAKRDAAATAEERSEFETQLEAASARAAELPALLEAADAVEQKRAADLAALQAAVSTTPAEPRKAPAIHVAKSAKGFDDVAQAVTSGEYLRGLARGELRAMSTGGVGAGKEYVPVELYGSIINAMTRTSVGLRVASVFSTISNKISLPKAGDATAAFYSEAAEGSLTDIATSAVDVTLFGLRSLTAVSNDLLEDSVIDVAALFASSVSNAFASKIDYAWLQGDVTAGIDGLVGEVSVGNTIEVADAPSTTATELADMVGKIDPLATNTSWVVSPVGFSALLAAHANTGSVMLSDAMAPTVFGRPVYVTNGLPAGTLALYGDFGMATAVAVKASGLRVEALREVRAVNDQVLFVAKQRAGIANHAPEYVSKLVVAS
jgi:HK97 family phage major capsid protein